MLESQQELLPAFANLTTGAPKLVDCIRVDGASDEGPSHEEVQFWWTQRHIQKEKVATLVTTRSSGSSFLNRVELQNGCLSLGHASTFIPSTLAGSCINQETGELDEVKLQRNLSLAIDAYINRVDGCPCGETTIHLYRGVDTSEHLQVRDSLLIFLKGSKSSKQNMKQKQPQLYAKFESVWDVRRRHMHISGLPYQYIFMLVCCFESDCFHPLCQKGKPDVLPTWYKEGPPITHLPLPYEERPWANPSCKKCKGFCAGHYKVKYFDVTSGSALLSSAQPPSRILKKEFSKLKEYPPHEDVYHQVAKRAHLSPEDTKIWIGHLHSIALNRKRGAQKAAATRRAKTNQNTGKQSAAPHLEEAGEASTYCGGCGKEYEDQTVEVELWIYCDLCKLWYCGGCEKLTSAPLGDTYLCMKCQS